MNVRETTNVEAVSGGPNQRVYIPSDLRVQHTWPFKCGESIGLEVVETACGRQVVVITKEPVEVAADSEIHLERSGSDVQGDLTAYDRGESDD